MNRKIQILIIFCLSWSTFAGAQTNKWLATQIQSTFKIPLSKISQENSHFKSSENILSDKDVEALKKIIDEKGFPSNSKVGENAAHSFWALVMECPDVTFQMKVLKLMHYANDKGDANPGDFAMLADRVLMNQDKPQLYGTQYVISKENGEPVPYKTQQPEQLQERRKSLNLSGEVPKQTKIVPKVKGTAQRGDPNARY